MFENDTVSSPEEAYLLGFLYADGCITSKRINSQGEEKFYCLSIGLAEKDLSLLEAIANFFSCDNKRPRISYCAQTKAYRLRIFDVKLNDNLIKLGLTHRKTYENTSLVFDKIPIEYKRYFILGLWDGDGGFSKNSRNQNLAYFISNNEALSLAIVVYLNSIFGEDFCRARKDKTYTRIDLVCNKAKIFGEWLYAEPLPQFFLARKYEQYNNFNLIRSRSHTGFDNYKTKGVICLDNNNCYITTKMASLGEFGTEQIANQIASVCNGRRKSCHNKHFRYMTIEEKEKFINGQSFIQMAEK